MGALAFTGCAGGEDDPVCSAGTCEQSYFGCACACQGGNQGWYPLPEVRSVFLHRVDVNARVGRS